MAHNITKKDKFAFTGSSREIWHGLGEQIPEGLTATEAFPRVGLDWATELVPCYADVAGRRVDLPETRAHIRKDTGDILGLVSPQYKALDNGDLAKFADALLGADAAATVSTCGSLLGGKRVFCLLQLPKVIVAARGDELDTYLCLSNGHGGFAAFCGYPTAIRVVCNNTLTLSERDLSRGFRFFHTGDFDAKLAQAKLILGFAQEELKKFEEQVKALVKAQLSEGQVKDFLDLAFTQTFGKGPNKEDEPEAAQRWAERKAAQMAQWLVFFNNERNSMKAIKGSAWAALNAYTEWSDHARGGAWVDTKMKTEPTVRVHSNLFGVSALAKRKVLASALKLV